MVYCFYCYLLSLNASLATDYPMHPTSSEHMSTELNSAPLEIQPYSNNNSSSHVVNITPQLITSAITHHAVMFNLLQQLKIQHKHYHKAEWRDCLEKVLYLCEKTEPFDYITELRSLLQIAV